MLTYTFSRREKALMLVLVVILLAVAWFVLVFQRTTNEVTRLDGEIAAAQTQVGIATTRVSQMEMMKAAIAEYEAAGARMVDIPEFDNVEPLMAELNGIMGAASTYTLSFDALDTETSDQYVLRSVRIDFATGSYDGAEAIIDALANGSYPCVIQSVSISDGSTNSRVRGATGSDVVSASAYVTFLEKYPTATRAANRNEDTLS